MGNRVLDAKVSSFFVAGDIHGRLQHIIEIDQHCVQNNISTVIQVGDFGCCWPGENCAIIRYFHKRNRQNRPGPTWFFLLGNHDNWRTFTRRISSLPKRTRTCWEDHYTHFIEYAPGLYAVNQPAYLDIHGGMLFLGGAVSSDASNRTLKKDWWPQEAPTTQDFERFLYLMESKKPRYTFTHDGPHELNRGGINPKSGLTCNYVAQNLTNITRISDWQPERWFYGHHHHHNTHQIDKTQYLCSGLHGQGWTIKEENATCTFKK